MANYRSVVQLERVTLFSLSLPPKPLKSQRESGSDKNFFVAQTQWPDAKTNLIKKHNQTHTHSLVPCKSSFLSFCPSFISILFPSPHHPPLFSLPSCKSAFYPFSHSPSLTLHPFFQLLGPLTDHSVVCFSESYFTPYYSSSLLPNPTTSGYGACFCPHLITSLKLD